MANKKKSRTSKKQSPQRRVEIVNVRRSRVPRRASMAGAGMNTRTLAQSLSNPFETSSCVPDGAKGVGCFTVKQTGTMTTGTGSCYMIAVNPQPDAQYYVDSGGSVATPTVTGNWSSATGNSSVEAFYGKVRPVSCGLRIVYTGNTINDQGLILVGQMTGGTALSVLNGVNLTNAAAWLQNYKTYPLRSGAQITWRPDAMDDIAEWEDTTTALTSTGNHFSKPYLVCIIYGAAASAASTAQFEFVANYEGQYTNQSFLPGGLVSVKGPDKAEPGWYEKAMNLIDYVKPIIPYVASAADSYFNTGGVVSGMTQRYGASDRSLFAL